MKPPAPVDAARWQAVSPLLDELMDLDEAAQAARLDELRARDPALAEELAGLMGRLDRLEDERFLDAPAIAPPIELAGQAVGAYTLERELGTGGMGSVWLARRTDGRYEGHVAIKFLQAGLFGGGNATRFQQEGNILARLNHPHIARLLDAGVSAEQGQPYLVLEYIDGESIDRYCEHQKLDVKARLRLFLDVLDAVAHAHNRLILHRDLKPSNILVTRDGQVKLLDFGIAKLLDDASNASGELTQQAGNAFTPQYAAPEQVQGGDVTTATDVYALGVLLYLLLSGRFPVEARTQTRLDQMRATVEQAPRTLSSAVAREGGPDGPRRARALRGDLDTIVGKALKKQPTERYGNAAALADDLRRHLEDQPISARPDGLAYLAVKFLRRNALAVTAGTLASLGLLVGAGLAMKQAHEARQQQAQAEGLIEFMIGDLRDRLRQVGRLDVLDAAGVKALAYYDQQDPTRLTAASIGRRAQAEQLRGELAEVSGNAKEAAAFFDRAARRTAAQLARYPDDPDRVYEHAQSEYWVGLLPYRHGDKALAEKAWLSYRDLAKRLLELEPDAVRSHIERAYAEQNLGVLYRNAGRHAEATGSFEACAAAWREILPRHAAAAIELANCLGFLSNQRESAGDFRGAIQFQRDKLDVLARMPDAGTNNRAIYLRANGWQEIGRLELTLGDLASAYDDGRRAVDEFVALTNFEPGNLESLAQATGARLGLMEAELALGLPEQARAMLPRVRADHERLVAADAEKLAWNIQLRSWVLILRARLASTPLEAASVTAELRGFLSAAGTRRPDKQEYDVRQRRALGAASLALGDLMAAAGHDAAARERWQAVVAWMRPMADKGELAALASTAQARVRLGDVASARAISDKLRASGYRHPGHADVERRLATVAGPAPEQP